MLMEVAPHLPVTYASSSLVSLLFDGVNWLKKAAKIHASCSRRKFKLSYAEEVLEQSKVFLVFSFFFSYPFYTSYGTDCTVALIDLNP